MKRSELKALILECKKELQEESRATNIEKEIQFLKDN